MLKKLLDEFVAKLCQCHKEEMNSQHAYNMVQEFCAKFGRLISFIEVLKKLLDKFHAKLGQCQKEELTPSLTEAPTSSTYTSSEYP